jgi:hypothetical protein
MPTEEQTAPATAPQTAALARVVPNDEDAFRLALEPNNVSDTYKLCASLAKTGICGIKSPEDALVRIMTGRALGLPAMVAMQQVYEVEGRPSISAKLKVALAMRHPECEYFDLVESTPRKATYKAKRRGRAEQMFSFTIEEAEGASLLGRGKDADAQKKNNWNRYPGAMLRARASSGLADILFPDATMGMPAREEVDDLEPGELRGEVVDSGSTPPKPANGAPPQAAPARDFEAELVAMKQRIFDAKTPEARKAVRGEVAAFVDVAPTNLADEAKRFYNVSIGEKVDSQASAQGARP